METHMKKYLAALLAAAMLFLLCACGAGGEAPDKQSESVNTEAPSTVPETEPEDTHEDIVYDFGATITSASGMFEFTPVFEGSAAAVANYPDNKFLQPDGKGVDESNNPYVADEGKVMMYFSATLKYVGDSKTNESFTFSYKIDYDNGYIFDGSTGGLGYSADEEKWDYNKTVSFEPLSSSNSRYVRFCVEVPDTLETDFEKQTLAIFTIEGEEYAFAVDTEAAAAAKAEREAAAEAEMREKLTEVDESLASEIKNVLQGTWSWSVYGYAGTTMYKTSHDLTFEGDNVSIATHNSLLNTNLSNSGTYTITKGYIVLDFQDGSQARMPYTYENGEISLSQEVEGAFYTA